MNSFRGLAVALVASALFFNVVETPAFAQASGSAQANGVASAVSPAEVSNPASMTKAQKKAARKEARKQARAKKNAELKALEQKGYRPGDTSPDFPQNALKAQEKTDVPASGQ
jgi:hypothetical protein